MINFKENLITEISGLNLAELQTAIVLVTITYQKRTAGGLYQELEAEIALNNAIVEIYEYGFSENLNSLNFLKEMEEMSLDQFPEIIHALATALLESKE